MNHHHTQYQDSVGEDEIDLPVPLIAALVEMEETAELVHTEIEEATELIDQRFQTVNSDPIPVHLVLENLLHQLLNCISQVMVVDTVAVLLQTEDQQELAVRATRGLEEEVIAGIKIPIGRGFAGCIAARGERMIVDDLSKIEVFSPILRHKGIKSIVGVPIIVEDRVVGVFHVGVFGSRQFTAEEAHLLQYVADHIGIAINHLIGQEKLAMACPWLPLSQAIKEFLFHLLPTNHSELVGIPQKLVRNYWLKGVSRLSAFYSGSNLNNLSKLTSWQSQRFFLLG